MGSVRLVATATLALAALACADDHNAAVAANGRDSDTTDALKEPVCEEIEVFAEALLDTGITYDYEPSDSPSDIASSADVVFGGRLTGQVDGLQMAVDDGPYPKSYIGYEIEITRVVKGSEVEVDDKVLVYVEYGTSHHRDADYYEGAVASGAPVAIFAFEDERRNGFISSLEGFITSCPDGTLLGWTGIRGAWGELRTTEQVLDAASGSTTTTP